MIDKTKQDNLIIECKKAFLEIEREELSKVDSPYKAKVVDNMAKKFEEIVKKYENKAN